MIYTIKINDIGLKLILHLLNYRSDEGTFDPRSHDIAIEARVLCNKLQKQRDEQWREMDSKRASGKKRLKVKKDR